MCKNLIPGFVGLWFIALAGCQEAKPKAAAAYKAPAVVETEVGTTDQQPEPVETVGCRSLNIPTYDPVIKDLSYQRCDICHNDNYAWRGINLTKFEAWKTYVEPIRNQIMKNVVTDLLAPGEQKIFLTWIDAGMPRTETDCANLE